MTAESTPEAVKREAFALYRGMIDEEVNPLLKDGMVLHLHGRRAALPGDLHAEVDAVKHVIGPDRPPYDAWFADGNDTVRVDWVTQDHAETINVKQLKRNGFELVSEEGDTKLLRRTIERDGVETHFEIAMRPFRSDMYSEVGDAGAGHHMHVYSGHSDWGRNMRRSLESAEAGDGGTNKLVFTELCVGKGEIQMFRDKFPNAHMVTTHNSSYFYPDWNSEGVQAFIRTAEGIAARRGYEAIAEDVHRHNPFRRHHDSAGLDNNFIFPTDLQTRRMVLDRDHDGQADIFDRLVDFSTFRVPEDTRREFEAIDPARPADELVGTKVHFASQTINRLALYSEIHEALNSYGKVVPAGYFEPGPGEEGLFRFERTEIGGKEAISMAMNARYAHMSEEALRMAACYEYNRYIAETEPGARLGGIDTKLSGLVLASHSLDTDAGYRDRAVWSAFLEAYDLPEIDRWDVEAAKEADDHYYSGSYASLDELKEKLPAEVLEALGRA